MPKPNSGHQLRAAIHKALSLNQLVVLLSSQEERTHNCKLRMRTQPKEEPLTKLVNKQVHFSSTDTPNALVGKLAHVALKADSRCISLSRRSLRERRNLMHTLTTLWLLIDIQFQQETHHVFNLTNHTICRLSRERTPTFRHVWYPQENQLNESTNHPRMCSRSSKSGE